MSRNSKFVADTNILLSSLFINGSTSFQAIEKASTDGFLIFSNDTFLEFELVLFRKKFDKYFSKDERLQIVGKFYEEGIFVEVTSNLMLCRDPKDDKFLNLAVDASATCIITGDQDLLVLHPFGEIPIITPFDFINTF